MKQITVALLFFFGLFTNFAQGQISNTYSIIRSTVGLAGSSSTVITSTGKYIVRQSIGQSSPIGISSKNGFSLRQGYQQPIISTTKIRVPVNKELDATIYPNPFQQSVSVSFNEEIKNDILATIFDMNGKLIFSQQYPPSQLIKMPLSNLPIGFYVLKILSKGKQFKSKLIKE